mmetsp:Transcript_40693/g.126843  ORF Transcript_40693/g.126843 Transcript_40693/m.126843 type:complete len:107 (+) Transcript_40693:1260-1580(+)
MRILKRSAECREMGPGSSSYEALVECFRGDWEGEGCARVHTTALSFVGDFARKWCSVNDGWGREMCKCSSLRGQYTAACNYQGDMCKICLHDTVGATCARLPEGGA